MLKPRTCTWWMPQREKCPRWNINIYDHIWSFLKHVFYCMFTFISILYPMTDPWCVPWIPSIYPLYVSIFLPAPWILWVLFNHIPTTSRTRSSAAKTSTGVGHRHRNGHRDQRDIVQRDSRIRVILDDLSGNNPQIYGIRWENKLKIMGIYWEYASYNRNPGWWFWNMIFFDFPYIGNFIIPTDELIFCGGVETTSQNQSLI